MPRQLISVIDLVVPAIKNQHISVIMGLPTEQAIITATQNATKVLGTGTAATGSFGIWQILLAHQQPILMICTFIGVILTYLSYRTNKRYLCRRDARENLEHVERMAVLKHQKEELKKRRVND